MIDVATSVIASLITVVAIGVIRVIWSYWVVNFWLQITCRHIADISGRWLYEKKDEGWSRKEEIEITQYGWKIKGTISYSYHDEGCAPANHQYRFEGIFRNELLSAYYWHTDRKLRGSGSFTLQLKEAGNVFEGYEVIYESDKSKLRQDAYAWKRVDRASA